MTKLEVVPLGGAHIARWRLKAGETGEWLGPGTVPSIELHPESVQISGAFSGARVHMVGSNDGETATMIRNGRGTPLVVISEVIEDLPKCLFVRPVVEGGDDGTDLVVTIGMRLK